MLTLRANTRRNSNHAIQSERFSSYLRVDIKSIFSRFRVDIGTISRQYRRPKTARAIDIRYYRRYLQEPSPICRYDICRERCRFRVVQPALSTALFRCISPNGIVTALSPHDSGGAAPLSTRVLLGRRRARSKGVVVGAPACKGLRLAMPRVGAIAESVRPPTGCESGSWR